MYELVQVGPRSYYINAPVKIGVYLAEENQVYLIDSGNDKDAGRKLRQLLEKQGWTLRAILNTHSNADHIGGNQYLWKQTGCKIYAPGVDCAFTRHPLLEPSFLYGGFPPKDLRHKFLMAKESPAEYLTDAVLPKGLTSFPLPGHFFDMVGFRSEDGVVYLADCLSSKETLEKYPIGFEALLQKLFTAYGLTMDFSQYVLVGSTVRSYLAWLKDQGALSVDFTTRIPLWHRVG